MIRHKEYDYCMICYDKWVVKPMEIQERLERGDVYKEIVPQSRMGSTKTEVKLFDKEFVEKMEKKEKSPERPTQSIICLPKVVPVENPFTSLVNHIPQRKVAEKVFPVEPGTFYNSYRYNDPVCSSWMQ